MHDHGLVTVFSIDYASPQSPIYLLLTRNRAVVYVVYSMTVTVMKKWSDRGTVHCNKFLDDLRWGTTAGSLPVALPDIGYLARSVNNIIDNENEREVASHPFRFVDSMRHYITRKPPTYALANYIGEPYQEFWLWASDRATGTEHDNRSPTANVNGAWVVTIGRRHGLEQEADVTWLFKI